MNTITSNIDNAKRPPNARREATYARICDVANALFFDQGFGAVTMEEIAKAAGIRRSTLYLHFRDKEGILDAIAKDYTAKLKGVIVHLPGPEPTREEIEDWVALFADFVSSEREATELLVSLSHLPNTLPAAKAFGVELKQMMGDRVAAFKRALDPGQPLISAWAISTLDGLGWALCHYARTGDNDISRGRLKVAAAALDRFVRGEF